MNAVRKTQRLFIRRKMAFFSLLDVLMVVMFGFFSLAMNQVFYSTAMGK